MSSDHNKSNQIALALETIKLLCEKPRWRKDLEERLSEFLEEQSLSVGNIRQKLDRLLRKLRDCGFEIDSAPNRPYELVESSFPVMLSTQQRQALGMAADFLAEMGFSVPAGQIIRIGHNPSEQPVKVNFNPPVDYGESPIREVVRQLQERFEKKCRFTIRYCSSRGQAKIWDIDRSELRFHDGVLYLFAFLPDWSSHRLIEQNVPLRVDRIQSVNAASNIPWSLFNFPTLKIRYRLSGPLGSYKHRRANELEIERDTDGKFVEIEAREDCLFWFRQRILKYGANAQIIEPQWLAEMIKNELQKAYEAYCQMDTARE